MSQSPEYLKSALVVGKEQAMRTYLFHALEAGSWDVLISANTKEALKILDGRIQAQLPLDLLVADIQNSKDRVGLVTQFHEKGFRGPVILISEFVDDVEAVRDRDYFREQNLRVAIMKKSFSSPRDLLEIAEELMQPPNTNQA